MEKKSRALRIVDTILWIVTIVLTITIGYAIWYNYVYEVNPLSWFKFWKYLMTILFLLSIFVVVWLIIGGSMDLRKLLRSLKEEVVDETDDGFVRDEKLQ